MYRVRGADQNVYGPIPAGMVSQWISERRLNAASEICREGQEQWLPLSQLPEFAAALAAQSVGGPSTPSIPVPPTNSGGGGGVSGGYPEDGGRQLARAAVDGPGIALIIVGVLGVLGALLGIGGAITGSGDPFAANPEMRDQIPPVFVRVFDVSNNMGVWPSVLGLLTSIYAIYCGLQLRQLRSYVHVIVGTVLAMIPCVGGCCCVGLPVGVWILIVTNRPDVRPYFTS